MKSRVTLFCNGDKAISCDLDGLEKEQIDDIAENLLICCVSRAIDELDEVETEKLIDAIKSFDFGIKIERITDDSMVPYKYREGVFDRIAAAVKKFFEKE